MDELERIAAGQGAAAREARRTLKRRAARRARGGDAGDDFAPLVDAIGDLAARLAVPERRRMARDVAAELRDINAKRERANVKPDGEAMAPRKYQGPKSPSGKARSQRLREGGKRKRRPVGLMFRTAWQARFLRKESSDGGAAVGFVGAMARIMKVHHYGLADTVTRDPGSPRVTYARRDVIGMTGADRMRILERITAQVAP